ncbi:MAG: response regulator [Terriglobales bacterium]
MSSNPHELETRSPHRIEALYLEDNEHDALSVRHELENDPIHDIHVTHVARLSEALHHIRCRRFDVLVADLDLPDSRGIATAERLREVAPEIPLVVLAEGEEHGFVVPLLQGGTQEYLTKRKSQNHLSRTIRHSIERHRVAMELDRRAKQLAESERQVRMIIDSNADAVIIVDPQGVVQFVNPAAEEMFGRAADQFIGNTFGFPIAGNTQKETTELDYVGPDGTARIAGLRVAKIEWNGVTSYLASLRDITANVQTESALKETLARLSTVLANAPIFLWALDPLGRIAVAEGRLLETLGLRPRDLVGHSAWDLFARHSMMMELTRRALRGEPLHDQVEFGGLVVETWYTPMLNTADDFAGTIGVGIDVTERVRLEEQFRESQKMEAVGRLAGGIAHDFNNLLSVIGSCATLTLEQIPRDMPHVRNDVEQIQQAADSAARLTSQLLAFSRRQIIQPRILNLNQEIARIQPILRRLIGEDIVLHVRLDPHLKSIAADPGQIEHLIINLAVNARDAMPQGGHLTIETSNVDRGEATGQRDQPTPSAPLVRIKVSDTGIGMDDATRRSIFEPFFTTKEKGRGTGLGLATVHGIVKQSGGSIAVDSQPGHGATFNILFPVAEQQQPERVETRATTAPNLRGNETILLAEDEEGVRATVQRMLEAQGYCVLVAANGEEALRISRQHPAPIHLLLTDVVMPGMGGRELAEVLCQERPLPVIYMSGYTDDIVLRHGVSQARVPFVQKPFQRVVLLQKVREVLELSETPLKHGAAALSGEIPIPEPANTPATTSARRHILFLDNEELIVQLAIRSLERFNYRVTGLTNPDEAMDVFRRDPIQFDWVIVDFNLSGPSGLMIAQELLAIRPGTNILLCSGAVTPDVRKAAQMTGIVDMIQKPSSLLEFREIIDRYCA